MTAQYELRYKGFPLLLNTAETDAAFAWLAPGALGLPGRGAPYGHNPPNDTLCRFQPGPPFVPRLNVLYWPRGAQRHAIGWFLVDSKTLQAIVNSDEKPILKMGDPDKEDNRIEAELFPLQPIPIPYLKTDNPDETTYVYVLPLVDSRYYWGSQIAPTAIERKPTGTAWQAFTAWQTVLDEVTAQIAPVTIGVPGGFDASFLQADTASIGLDDEPNDLTRTIADVVDAVAWNNLRWNVWPYSIKSGSASEPRCILENAFEALTTHRENLVKFITTSGATAAPHVRRGGWVWSVANQSDQDADPVLGSLGSFGVEGLARACKLRTCFVDKQSRKPNKGHVDTAEYVLSINAGHQKYPGPTLIIRDTFQTYSDGTNSGVVSMLNESIGSRMAFWEFTFFDFTLNGICNWKPNGYADLIEFAYRWDDCYTRIRSQPVDWWRSWNGVFNHQSEDALRPLPDYLKATATVDIASGASGNVTAEADGRTLTIASPFGDIAKDDLIGIEWNRLVGDGIYEAIVKKC